MGVPPRTSLSFLKKATLPLFLCHSLSHSFTLSYSMLLFCRYVPRSRAVLRRAAAALCGGAEGPSAAPAGDYQPNQQQLEKGQPPWPASPGCVGKAVAAAGANGSTLGGGESGDGSSSGSGSESVGGVGRIGHAVAPGGKNTGQLGALHLPRASVLASPSSGDTVGGGGFSRGGFVGGFVGVFGGSPQRRRTRTSSSLDEFEDGDEGCLSNDSFDDPSPVSSPILGNAKAYYGGAARAGGGRRSGGATPYPAAATMPPLHLNRYLGSCGEGYGSDEDDDEDDDEEEKEKEESGDGGRAVDGKGLDVESREVDPWEVELRNMMAKMEGAVR